SGGQARTTPAVERAARDGEEDGRERYARDRGQEPTGPGLVAEEPDADGNEQLRRRRMHPLRGVLSLQVLQGGLRVIALVEDLLRGEPEAREPERRRHQQEPQSDEAVATRTGWKDRQTHGSGVYGGG